MSTLNQPIKVMIAGIGGASLGTEIGKCLRLAGKYEIYGCDISPTAYGLYDKGFTETFRINRDDYVAEVLKVCHQAGAKWLIPGGEQPNALLGAAAEQLAVEGIRVVTNDAATVGLFSDKQATFKNWQRVVSRFQRPQNSVPPMTYTPWGSPALSSQQPERAAVPRFSLP